MNVAALRSRFPGLQNTIYLNTATMAVGCAAAQAAFVEAAEHWAAGRFDWLAAERAGEQARQHFAGVVGAQPAEIALIPTVSLAAGLVATSLAPARRGDNILVTAEDFSSNYFPWLMLRDRGFEIRMIPTTPTGVSVDAYAAAADARTRLLAVSAVQSLTGYQVDLPSLGEIAARSGAWFFVDACQAAGAIPLDVGQARIDFLAAASHKFLLGTRGMGYLFVRQDRLNDLRPSGPGWKAGRNPLESFYGPTMELSPSASRFDASLNWFAALAELGGIAVFQDFGLRTLLTRNAHLSRCAYEAAARHGLITPPFPEDRRSTIVSIEVPDAEAVLTRLRDANVVATVRGGRVRLSAHFYNTEDDILEAVRLIAHG